MAALVAFGAALARRGAMARLAIAVSAATAGGGAFVALLLSRRGDLLADVPIVASSAAAWGGGFLLAVAASASALRRDRVDGIHRLVVARTASLRGYALARVIGLAVTLAVVVGGAVVVTSAVALALASRSELLRLAQATAASVVFAIGFAVVLAPLALAALGAHGRGVGYLRLLLVLFGPEVALLATRGTYPSAITELLAVPAALSALRASLAPDTVDGGRFVRALLALIAIATVAMLVVRRDVARLDRDADPS